MAMTIFKIFDKESMAMVILKIFDTDSVLVFWPVPSPASERDTRVWNAENQDPRSKCAQKQQLSHSKPTQLRSLLWHKQDSPIISARRRQPVLSHLENKQLTRRNLLKTKQSLPRLYYPQPQNPESSRDTAV